MLSRLFQRTRPSLQDEVLPRSDMVLIREAAEDEFVDVEALADQMGIAIEDQPYRPEICGTLQPRGNGWVIGVNRADDFTRRRFTIAHEIGHYVLHRDLVMKRTPLPGIADTHDYRQPDIASQINPHVPAAFETQANRIAVRILMGESKMRRLIEEGLNAEQIATLIGCSVKSTEIRVNCLRAEGL